MKIEHVDGENRGKILLYALSTCGWCRKTKEFLSKLGVEYSYIYVDLVDDSEKDKVIKEVRKFNPRNSYPTIVINDKECIVGYNEDEIREVLGK
ncbi:MAG: glutaredoxin family protein [Thermoplasmatales archaeon]|nr:MAG: glutaredoxin family protein [Thermoplasmatales archaeon]